MVRERMLQSVDAPVPAPEAELIAVGRIARVWGLDGGLVVEPTTSDGARFEALSELWVISPRGTRRARVRAYRCVS